MSRPGGNGMLKGKALSFSEFVTLCFTFYTGKSLLLRTWNPLFHSCFQITFMRTQNNVLCEYRIYSGKLSVSFRKSMILMIDMPSSFT